MGVEEIDQAARERGQVHTARRGRGEELRGTRCRVVQSVHCPASPRGALLVRQVLDMRCLLDLCAAIVTAPMRGDDGIGVPWRFKIDSARMLRAELPVHRNSTL